MDNKRYRVAAASSDNLCVNQHFGRAGNFFIAEVDEDGNIYPIEERKVTPVCNRGQHDDAEIRNAVEVLSDCEVVVAAKIGYGASEELKSKGILVFELPGLICDSIKKIDGYIKLMRELYK
ncbi:NifB/NifX family molybdenum-iron cluster-binding protein [Lachnospiraceae bacterium C1.1]|nr:NifB/NifX family molybdenum-iron cluster-binding protein [Lachnospiraceae bacterium C1.1]